MPTDGVSVVGCLQDTGNPSRGGAGPFHGGGAPSGRVVDAHRQRCAVHVSYAYQGVY